MAQEYHNPFIIRFSRNTPEVTKPNELVLSDMFQRDLMKTISSQLNAGNYDYIAVSFDDTIQNKRQCNMMMTLINKVGSERLMPVINRQNQKLYLTSKNVSKNTHLNNGNGVATKSLRRCMTCTHSQINQMSSIVTNSPN